MENASKALIIAGAILLSILIIALGIYVFNMAKNATNTDSLDELSIRTFNAPILDYEGRQIGNQVKTLLNNIIAGANTNSDADEKLPDIVYIDWNGSKSTGPNINVAGTTGFGKKADGDTIVSDVSNTNIDAINNLRSGISNSHYYQVQAPINTTSGLVEKIIIKY